MHIHTFEHKSINVYIYISNLLKHDLPQTFLGVRLYTIVAGIRDLAN